MQPEIAHIFQRHQTVIFSPVDSFWRGNMRGNQFITMGFFAMLGTACSKPPPAPESLNEAVRYMFREFYSADPEFQAGVQGFMNWYNEEGKEIADVQASLDTAHKYSLEPLTMEDIEYLPLDAEILIDPKENTMDLDW